MSRIRRHEGTQTPMLHAHRQQSHQLVIRCRIQGRRRRERRTRQGAGSCGIEETGSLSYRANPSHRRRRRRARGGAGGGGSVARCESGCRLERAGTAGGRPAPIWRASAPPSTADDVRARARQGLAAMWGVMCKSNRSIVLLILRL